MELQLDCFHQEHTIDQFGVQICQDCGMDLLDLFEMPAYIRNGKIEDIECPHYIISYKEDGIWCDVEDRKLCSYQQQQ